MAAAAWSWVEKMLHEAQRTSAPSAVSVSISTAVWMVMCSEPVMRAPLSGWVFANSSRMAIRPAFRFRQCGFPATPVGKAMIGNDVVFEFSHSKLLNNCDGEGNNGFGWLTRPPRPAGLISERRFKPSLRAMNPALAAPLGSLRIINRCFQKLVFSPSSGPHP